MITIVKRIFITLIFFKFLSGTNRDRRFHNFHLILYGVGNGGPNNNCMIKYRQNGNYMWVRLWSRGGSFIEFIIAPSFYPPPPPPPLSQTKVMIKYMHAVLQPLQNSNQYYNGFIFKSCFCKSKYACMHIQFS